MINPAASEPSPMAENAPSRSRKKLWLILILSLVGVCSLVCVTLLAMGIFKTFTERGPVASVLDTFMTYMAQRDPGNAYELLSPRAQRQMKYDELAKLVNGSNFVLFDGYQDLTVQELNVSAAVNTNPDLPQGQVAQAGGMVSYEGGFSGHFSATLEKVGGEWRIHNMNVTVSPDKLDPGAGSGQAYSP